MPGVFLAAFADSVKVFTERPDGATRTWTQECLLSLGYDKAELPGVELIGVALVLRWCVSFNFSWCSGIFCCSRCPPLWTWPVPPAFISPIWLGNADYVI